MLTRTYYVALRKQTNKPPKKSENIYIIHPVSFFIAQSFILKNNNTVRWARSMEQQTERVGVCE